MSGHYTRPLIPNPENARQGIANAVQSIINRIEAGDAREALLQAVNLLDDVRSNANPYLIGKARKRKPASTYRGDVNID